MTPQHLSDEAVAAFADGVLRGHARERAARHLDGCAECREAVRIQREAAAAVRAAPPPALPGELLAKLRTVPLTTPLPAPPPTAVAPDGSAMFATFAPVAALVPDQAPGHGKHRMRTFFTTAALVGAAGAVVAGSVAAAQDGTPAGADHPAHPVSRLSPGGSGQPSFVPINLFRGSRP